MKPIINGNFTDLSAAKVAVSELIDSGYPQDQISFFRVEIPGHYVDKTVGVELVPDATETKVPEAGVGAMSGAAVGGAIGAVVALATLPVLGPMVAAAAVSVGAYGGSLYGVLDSMDADETDNAEKLVMTSQKAMHRQSGTVVAVIAEDVVLQEKAKQILKDEGASDIELTEGNISNSEWTDFNSAIPLKLLPA